LHNEKRYQANKIFDTAYTQLGGTPTQLTSQTAGTFQKQTWAGKGPPRSVGKYPFCMSAQV